MIAKNFGLSCFSTTEKNILMWSHYAYQHRGFIIGFDFDNIKNHIRPITYSSERIQLPLIRTGMEEYFFDRTLTTKSLGWAYEKESRLILPLSHKKCKKMNSYYFYAFDPDNVKSIILGARIKEDLKKKILDLTKKFYPSATLYKAELSHTDYRLDISPLSIK